MMRTQRCSLKSLLILHIILIIDETRLFGYLDHTWRDSAVRDCSAAAPTLRLPQEGDRTFFCCAPWAFLSLAKCISSAAKERNRNHSFTPVDSRHEPVQDDEWPRFRRESLLQTGSPWLLSPVRGGTGGRLFLPALRAR